MQEETKEIDWNEFEDNLVTQWYYIQKIMGQWIPSYFPYVKYKGIIDCIDKDPQYKKQDEE